MLQKVLGTLIGCRGDHPSLGCIRGGHIAATLQREVAAVTAKAVFCNCRSSVGSLGRKYK
ncbi:hypothetical protein TanjilG_28777 [Lupinus angustifolius]|uniref:Uncharacterized protein n=1 Tax=Lupinus angustifolius TaxID=3871 RepID=A0A394D8I7_LUPAN|nr:hypothetical protein TanjilG_28777 [Lupinus angustifolius]